MDWQFQVGQRLCWNTLITENKSFQRFLIKKFGKGPFELIEIINHQTLYGKHNFTVSNIRQLEKRLRHSDCLLAVKAGNDVAILPPHFFILFYDPNPNTPIE